MKILSRFLQKIWKPSFPQTGPSALRPVDKGMAVVVEGESNHRHIFSEIPWNSARDGKDVLDFDQGPGGPMVFPKATFRTLLRCTCGREEIKSVRAFI